MLSAAPLMQIAMKVHCLCQCIVGGPAVAMKSAEAEANETAPLYYNHEGHGIELD